jgi:hypothetical protein
MQRVEGASNTSDARPVCCAHLSHLLNHPALHSSYVESHLVHCATPCYSMGMFGKLQLPWPLPPRQSQHPSQEQLSTPAVDPNQPHVGLVLVNITPAEHETAFWESAQFRASAAAVDSWSFIERGCSLLLILRLCACGLPVDVIGFPRRNLLNCQLIGILHVVLKKAAPSLYAPCRFVLALHYR